jgi:hypothetical protein
MSSFQKRVRQGKAEGTSSQAKRNIIPLKHVEYNACQAKHWKSIPTMLMGEAQPLGMGAREPGCEHKRKDEPCLFLHT